MTDTQTHTLTAQVHHGQTVITVTAPLDFAGATENEIVDSIEEAIHYLRDETELGYYAPVRDRARDLAGRIYAHDGEFEHGWVRYQIDEA